ncbi:MAG: hypothetical protein ACRDZ4_08265 [Egibacteraceae bacterium]
MSIAFFTVCGGVEEYEFLLASIEHHAALSQAHVVLDTTPSPESRRFQRLPKTVRWVHEPLYGSGTSFRYVAALNRAIALAEEDGADALFYLDADEYFAPDIVAEVAPLACERLVEFPILHHIDERSAWFVPLDCHFRAWPARRGVRAMLNLGWQQHPLYDGNPEWHALVQAPPDVPLHRLIPAYHHHLHFVLGKKTAWDSYRHLMLGERVHDRVVPISSPWPPPVYQWYRSGVLPSSHFS